MLTPVLRLPNMRRLCERFAICWGFSSMKYELHPLCTFFPRLNDDEFKALKAGAVCLRGVKNGDPTIFYITPSDYKGFFNVAYLAAASKESVTTEIPVTIEAACETLSMLDNLELFSVEAQPFTVSPSTDGCHSVYFIQPIQGGLVKIGVSNSPRSRLDALQCGCPVELQIVKTIDGVSKDLERRIHKQFEQYRVRGEWFDPCVLNMEVAP